MGQPQRVKLLFVKCVKLYRNLRRAIIERVMHFDGRSFYEQSESSLTVAPYPIADVIGAEG